MLVDSVRFGSVRFDSIEHPLRWSVSNGRSIRCTSVYSMCLFFVSFCFRFRLCLGSGLAEITAEGIQKSFEELVMGKYIDKVAKLDLVTPTVEPEKAK